MQLWIEAASGSGDDLLPSISSEPRLFALVLILPVFRATKWPSGSGIDFESTKMFKREYVLIMAKFPLAKLPASYMKLQLN